MENKENIKLSIIMPTYNVEKYVSDAIESVLFQKYTNFELICIDNASVDNTESILREYAEKDCRVRAIFNEKNEGISFSRNRGLEEATGDYILFLDADDKFVDNSLERVQELVRDRTIDILFFDAIAEYENEELREKFGQYKPNRKGFYFAAETGSSLFAEFMKARRYTDVLWRQCMRREFLERERIRFTPGKLHEDVVFSMKAILSAINVKCVQEEFYIYYRREGSLTSGEKIQEALQSRLENYCEILRFWQRREWSDEVNEAIRVYLEFGYMDMIHSFRYIKGIEKMEVKGHLERHVFNLLKMNRNMLGEYREEISKYSEIIIYGAGYVAEKVLREFWSEKIIGIAVTKLENNPEEKFGLKVKELKSYREKAKTALVIVCVMPKTQEEIIDSLKREGFTNYICAV